MEKQEIILDANNAYVQTLMKIFNEFVLEESFGLLFTELRLKDKIKQARSLFSDERIQLIEQNRNAGPIIGQMKFSEYKVIIK